MRFPTSALIVLIAGSAIASGCARPPGDPSPVVEAAPGLENGSFFAELAGPRIHYEVHGRGPVLMTVPNSWGLTLDGLRALYRPLEQHLTLVYFDPRGMGESGPVREAADMGPDAVRADFDTLRQHLGLERVHAIGWSNGAANLILLAAEYPDTLDSAIFLHGTASFTQDDLGPLMGRYGELFEKFGRFTREMAESPELSAAERNERVKRFDLEQWFPRLFADPDGAAAILREMYDGVGFSWDHAQYTQQVWPTFDARDRLPEVTARSLVIVGRHDMLPVAKGEELNEALADSRLVVFEQSGHFAPVEEPELFRATVVDFLGAR